MNTPSSPTVGAKKTNSKLLLNGNDPNAVLVGLGWREWVALAGAVVGVITSKIISVDNLTRS
jgi:hypothetical protein